MESVVSELEGGREPMTETQTSEDNQETPDSPAKGEDEAKNAAAQEPEEQRSLLVVEDNPVMVAIISKILTRMDVTFDVASDGLEAIKACEQGDYELLLMDINMPAMNGIDATRKIRALSEHYATAPIIAVTANLAPEEVEAYRAAGMTDCVKKPVNQIDLGRMIDTYVAEPEEEKTRSARRYSKHALQMDQLGEDELDALNWDTLREYSGIMKEGFPKLLRDYLTAGPKMMDRLSDAMMEENGEALAFLAHKLKSTSIVFGAESVSTLAAQLEVCGRENDMEKTSLLFKELHICFERTNAVLRKKLVLMRMGS